MTLNNNSPTDNLIREKWDDAPERIWLMRSDEGYSFECAEEYGRTYIREDIHRAQADRDRARIEALVDAMQCLLALVGTPIARRKLGIAPDDERVRIVRAALANTASDKEQTDGHE